MHASATKLAWTDLQCSATAASSDSLQGATMSLSLNISHHLNLAFQLNIEF